MKEHRIVVIPGDGIGPELVDAALQVLHVAAELDGGFRLHVERVAAGAQVYRQHGTPITDAGLAACLAADAVLKGPVGLPEARRPDGTEGGLLGGVLRGTLDLYANVRPISLWPGVEPRVRHDGPVDYVVVRENTEGLYASRGLGVANRWAASDTLLMTRPGVERIVRHAFALAERRAAPTHRRAHVTCVDKSNVLKSFAFFRTIFTEVATEHPNVEIDFLHTDAAAQALVLEPGVFDVLVMENFVGDLLSELAAATIGGVGLCPSGNYGERLAYFEPIHGSAPRAAGRDLANPVGQILAGAMLLEHVGESGGAALIQRAVGEALAASIRIGPDGSVRDGTRAATSAVVAEMHRLSA